MDEILKLMLTAIFGGGLGVAVVTAINERWKFKAQRNAVKEDRAEEKADKTKKIEAVVEELKSIDRKQDLSVEARFKAMEEQISAQSKAMQLILLDRILYLGQKFIDEGEISFDDRRRLRAMHDCYHNGLHGNGDADLIMSGLDKLTLKRAHEEEKHED